MCFYYFLVYISFIDSHWHMCIELQISSRLLYILAAFSFMLLNYLCFYRTD